MPSAARSSSVATLTRRRSAASVIASWRPVWSTPAAMRAIRAAIVVPGLFAFADQALGNLQIATFAAFGGFATLVLVSFAGTRREKLMAHVALALTGSVLVVIGTAVTSTTALAVAVTLPVTFAVFFAGVAGPNAAAGVNGALLAYVLPAASPGTVSMIPDRLAGWWLASAVGTVAVLTFSPRPGDDRLRATAAALVSRLVDTIEAALAGEPGEDHLTASFEAKRALLAQFTATPYRPTGLAAPDEALANTVELLQWCASLVGDMVRERSDLRDASAVERELLAAAAAVLGDVRELLQDGRARPDLVRLERARDRSVAALAELSPAQSAFRERAQLSFHAHMIGVASLAIAADALVAARLADPAWFEQQRRRWYAGSRAGLATSNRVSTIASAALRHASVRSVWLVSSLRGAVALTVAVAVADLTSVQHGFWVVLGTLSVLRSNASATGATALRALAGTVLGFVVGGLLIVAIGAESSVLWVVLPLAVLIAAYAPGTMPFAVGQAAFTVTVAVLFNLLVPVGWQVGVVRIEDVALGCAVSVAVGLLFWPRGLSAVVGDDLADVFRAGASYLNQSIGWATNTQQVEPEGGAATLTAASRLDEALRGYLSEQGSKRVHMQELWTLVGGSLRLRLTAYSIAELPREETMVDAAQAALAQRTGILAAWFGSLAEVVGRPHGPATPALESPSFADADKVELSSGSYYGVWLCEHLDHLAEHLGDLVTPAVRLAEIRRRPWWR